MLKRSHDILFLASSLFALLMGAYALYNYIILRKELDQQHGLTESQAMSAANMSLIAVAVSVVMVFILLFLYFGFR